MGNLKDDEAKKAYDLIKLRAETWPGAKATPAADEQIRRVVPVLKPAKPVEVRKLNMRPDDPNDAIVVSFLVDVSTLENRVIYGLITSVLKTTAYNELRTTRQLGYVVNAGIQAVSNVQYVSCVVQGDKLNADRMEGAVEHVLTTVMPQALADMPEEQFHTHVQSMKEMLLQPPSNINEEFAFFLGPIAEGGNCFHLRDEMLDYLLSGTITKDLLLSSWNDIIAPQTGIRNKLLVKHFGKQVPPRPSKEESKKLWAEQNVSEKSIALMEREYDAAVLLDKVDSEERKKLAKTGTFYATDINCKRKEASSALLEEQQAASKECRQKGQTTVLKQQLGRPGRTVRPTAFLHSSAGAGSAEDDCGGPA
jgi:secreted Zn-dependent insulinase-like peptidase